MTKRGSKRKKRGSRRNPKGPKVESMHLRVIPDEDPDTSYLEQDEFDDRLKAYKRGEFNFVGVRAEAQVEIGGITQTITSAGLWGIEDDSGDDYLRNDVGKDEYGVLVEILEGIGATGIPPFEKVRLKH